MDGRDRKAASASAFMMAVVDQGEHKEGTRQDAYGSVCTVLCARRV